MDRDMLLEHLAMAELHIGEGERHLTMQRILIEALVRRGQDATAARQVLSTLENAQSLHQQHRADIFRQLDK